MDLTEVLEDLDKRKSMKCDGKLSIAQTIKVENIDLEILTRGLELNKLNLNFTKSYGGSKKLMEEKEEFKGIIDDSRSIYQPLKTCPGEEDSDFEDEIDGNLFDRSSMLMNKDMKEATKMFRVDQNL